MNATQLVAHRGWPRRYPENTLAGIEAALAAGALAVEVDVQFSADGVPVLAHDAHLSRCAGVGLAVADLSFAELAEVPVGEPDRLGDRFAGARIPTLATAVAAIARRDDARLLVELKRTGLASVGIERALDVVLPQLEAVAGRATLISFSRACIAALLARGSSAGVDGGWILAATDAAALDSARELGAPLLVANVKRLPDGDAPLPPGPWRWAVYAVNEPAAARRWLARGAALVETDDIGGLIDAADPAGESAG